MSLRLPLAAVSAGLAATALAVVLIRRSYLVVTVEGISMMPTLADGDRVLMRRASLSGIKVGQLVVAGPPTGERWDRMSLPSRLIKRVAAVPGDPVPRDGAPALRDLPEDRVPDGRIVLLGDNPEQSLDSRFCGYFREEQIFGVVVRRLPSAPLPHSPPYSPAGRDALTTGGGNLPPPHRRR